ncbi:unnamed protein product [Pleuronectes platessa]|uniref:Uncharacterized protein n=1 Tax=Pleuronectes platessa TaxID=8262 RepID=A0A9N7YU69_PLEPL|nr:unnamed protein product [Pleuronectes platessa]
MKAGDDGSFRERLHPPQLSLSSSSRRHFLQSYPLILFLFRKLLRVGESDRHDDQHEKKPAPKPKAEVGSVSTRLRPPPPTASGPEFVGRAGGRGVTRRAGPGAWGVDKRVWTRTPVVVKDGRTREQLYVTSIALKGAASCFQTCQYEGKCPQSCFNSPSNPFLNLSRYRRRRRRKEEEEEEEEEEGG